MQFKHPELLYALFLLLIPLLVHLFQLRRFQKEEFTNVKFLKKSFLQTRKSSQIKRWLILLTRILILTAVIFAFAQPYFSASDTDNQEQETVVYLDNSYSMQAKGPAGILLKRSVQELLENLPVEKEFSFFTNDAEYKGITLKTFKNELQRLSYSPQQLEWKAVQVKADNLFSDRHHTQKNLIVISDFQYLWAEPDTTKMNYDVQHYLVQLEANSKDNISIDTAFISSKSLDGTELGLKIKSSPKNNTGVSIGIYNGEKLLAKKTISVEDSSSASLFPLPKGTIENGKVRIEDSGFEFDNELYFSINKPDPIKVVVVGNQDSSFLKRIYREPDFTLTTISEDSFDHSVLSTANLVVLNEPKTVSLSLKNSLLTLVEENAYLIIIPSVEVDPEVYNPLLRELNLPLLGSKKHQERLITDIIFSHPLFKSVFEEQVRNFEYPVVHTYYGFSNGVKPVLGYENGEAFLANKDNIFLFSSALNKENSNFQSSPLVVPTFYNFGNLSLPPIPLYYVLGKSQRIDIAEKLEKDQVLKIKASGGTFIPLQQNYPNKVTISLDNTPTKPGHYKVIKDSAIVNTLSFNVSRTESNLRYFEPKASKNSTLMDSVAEAFNVIESQNNINSLWKWFVILALFFLLIEMLILKFIK